MSLLGSSGPSAARHFSEPCWIKRSELTLERTKSKRGPLNSSFNNKIFSNATAMNPTVLQVSEIGTPGPPLTNMD